MVQSDNKFSWQDMDEKRRVYNDIRSLLLKYAPPLVRRFDDGKRFELWSEKPVVILGRKKKEVFFAAVIIQKEFVGFYFMPVYTDVEMIRVIQPELRKLLKGKSCFHIKKCDAVLLRHIKDALAAGYEQYRMNGWI